MAGDSGYEMSEEEGRQLQAEHAARLAAQGYPRAQQELDAQNAFQAAQAAQAIQETQQAAAQAQARADTLVGTPVYEAAQAVANDLMQQAATQQVQQAYYQNPSAFTGATQAPRTISTEGLTAANLDWRGQPTLYLDSSGNVKGVYTSAGVVPVDSLNVLSGGKPVTADTLVQATTEDGQKLYLSDPNDPSSQTTRNTGIPAIGGTVAQQAFFMPKDSSGFGTIAGDFAGMAKDPAFWKFLASAAAITGGGLALNSAFGVGGLGAAGGATAFPVAEAGLLGATELGAAGAGGMSAAEALTAAANAGGLGAEFGVQGALGGLGAAGAGGMSAAEALALASEGGLGAEFGVQGALAANPSWLAAIEAALPAGAMGSLVKGGLTLGGLAALSALAPKQGGGGSTGGTPSLSADQLKAIVSTMPSAMGQYMSLAGNPYGYGGGTIDSANANLANLFPGFSLPTAGPYFGAGRFGDYYAPQALPTAPISPTGLV
jgi:hypothetical protein